MQITKFPVPDWHRESPESQGIDSDKLREALSLLDRRIGAQQAVLVRNGALVWEGEESHAFHQIFSCTKTFTTSALGLMIGDRRCSLEDRAADYYPRIAEKFPEYGKIAMRHLATMTSGYEGEKGIPDPELRWGDPNYYIFPASPQFEAGTEFKYDDSNVYLLGYILTKLAGQTLEDIFRERIAGPIGMKRFEWRALPGAPKVDRIALINPAGSPYPVDGGGVYTTPRDFARYGLLYLNGGNWHGTQVLPSGWADLACTNQVQVSLPARWYDLAGRYGFMWWTNGNNRHDKRAWPGAPERTFTPHGAGRNFCFVIPEWHVVFVRMADAPAMPHTDKSGHNANVDAAFNDFFIALGEAIDL